MAQKTGFSKSRVHRLKQAMERRDRHPASWWWESAEGRSWFVRLVVAVLSTFGLTRGVGADTISECFQRLRLETPIGCSPSALRELMHPLEGVILETAAAWEREGIAAGNALPLIGAADETVLARMMLGCIGPGQWLPGLEEVAEERTYDAWDARVKSRLEAVGVSVRSLVSDRAKALIQLAETGLQCLSVPDVFHLIHELAKSYALALYCRLRQARQALSHAQERLATCQASDPSGTQAQQAQALVEASAAEVQRWEQVSSAYRHHLFTLSLIMHPWGVFDSRRQSSAEVAQQWQAEIAAIETRIANHGFAVKTKTLDKVRKPLTGLAALVDFWWQGVWQDGHSQMVLTPAWTHWIAALLLPLMYGQQQVPRTACPRRKAKMLQALDSSSRACV